MSSCCLRLVTDEAALAVSCCAHSWAKVNPTVSFLPAQEPGEQRFYWWKRKPFLDACQGYNRGHLRKLGKTYTFLLSWGNWEARSPNICWENQEEAEVFIRRRKWEGSAAAAVTLSGRGACTGPCCDSHPVALVEQEAINAKPSVLPVPTLQQASGGSWAPGDFFLTSASKTTRFSLCVCVWCVCVRLASHPCPSQPSY